MPRPARQDRSVTPGQAHYVLQRLIAERRISPGDIARYAADMQREITELEARIAHLRAISGAESRHRATAPAARVRAAAAPQKAQPRHRRRGNPLAGSYMGYMRQVKEARKKAEFKKIKEGRGFAEAIAALKQHLGK